MTSTTVQELAPGANGLALDINASGRPVGTLSNAATFFDPIAAITTPTGTLTEPTGINASGVVVGYGNQTGVGNRGWMFGPSGVVWLPTPSSPSPFASATDINDSGWVVGSVGDDFTCCSLPALWMNATSVTTLGHLGGGSGDATAINNAGVIVGTSSNASGWPRAFRMLHTASAPTDLGVLPGGLLSIATDVSDAGDVVGMSLGARQHAVLWSGTSALDLAPACDSLNGAGSNSIGQGVAGSAASVVVVVGSCGSRPIAWYVLGAGRVVAEFLPMLPGDVAGVARAVNESRQAVGESANGGGTFGSHPVRWQLVVPNLAPEIVASPTPVVGDEGATLSFSVSASDPNGDPLTYTWDFGDGSAPSTGATVAHAFPDNGEYTVTVTVSDGTQAVTAQTTATTANVAPTGTLVLPSTDIASGSTFAATISGATDPSVADVAAGLLFSFDCESDGIYTTPSSTPSATCTAGAPGTQTVAARVTDKEGGQAQLGGVVNVVPAVNLPPTLTVGGPYTGAEGSAIALSASGADPESQPLTYTWNFGDGSPIASGANVSHAFPDNGAYTVTVTVSDGVNNTSASTTATVSNVAPRGTITAPAGTSAPQGSVVLSLGNIVEPSPIDAAGLSYRFNCGGSWGPAVSTPSTTCSLPTTGTYTLRVAVRDKDGGQGNYSKTVTITNVGPSVTILSPTNVTIPVGTALTFSASFTDPGTADNPWTARVGWGSGQGVQTLGAVSPGVPFGASRVYTTAGTYSVQVEVADKFGAVLSRGRITLRVQ